MMAPGASSDVPQKFAVFPLESEPALVVRPDFATNAADLWVRDLHIVGNPVIDTSLTPETLPEDDQRSSRSASLAASQCQADRCASEHPEGAGSDGGANRRGDGRAGAVRKGGDHESLAKGDNHGLLRSDSSDSDGQDGRGVIPTQARRGNQ